MNTDLNYTTYVCAGSVVLVADEVSGPDRQDGLDALLYAHTVASHKFPEFGTFDDWAQANKMAVRTLGGTLYSDSHVSIPPLPDTFSLSELLPQVMGQRLPDAALRSLIASLEQLSCQDPTSPPNELLRKHAVQQCRWIRLQLGVMSAGTRMAVFTIAFEYGEPVADSLAVQRFRQEKVNTNLTVSGYQALVEREDYDLSRDTVIALLESRRQEQVIELR
ncbi:MULTISPECIES: hypothetical protein [Pseudomonas]|uniref:Uncharacterized protein n=1 Tax=Pseudomonas fluorescens TaxID=294 RepID=A0A5E6PFQ7_PSEFL|nr:MULTISPECIES: hypothetical protein [Pseudomonas]MCP1421355.1 hypothetical protein [Pseudomonas laurylsulfativorans]VVM42292.1 hypothetical protein PS659_00337 [Pseudomonas fluorescens]